LPLPLSLAFLKFRGRVANDQQPKAGLYALSNLFSGFAI
jgi:hypothetical protein